MTHLYNTLVRHADTRNIAITYDFGGDGDDDWRQSGNGNLLEILNSMLVAGPDKPTESTRATTACSTANAAQMREIVMNR